MFSGCKKEDPIENEPPKDPLTYDEGVVINGVKWATRNVDKPGIFTATPESAGMLYQWNRKIGWSATDPIVNSNGSSEWNSSIPLGEEWITENNPCPKGWRVPTESELQTLLDAGYIWTTKNGINGCLFGSRNNTIFLPAYQIRNQADGSLNVVSGSTRTGYWSSNSSNDNDGVILFLTCDDGVDTKIQGNRKSYGFQVRPVAE